MKTSREEVMSIYVGARRLAQMAATLVVIAAVIPGRAAAQVASGGSTTINSTSTGYLGILQLKCDCTLRLDREDRFRSFNFRTDPVVVAIEAGSPADGVLRQGDYITHIDGLGLRSTEGAERFSRIRPGQTVDLTISRNGTRSNKRITATPLDWSDRRVLGTLAPSVDGYAAEWLVLAPDAPETPVVAGQPPTPARPARPGVAPRVWTEPPTPRTPSSPRAAVAPSARPGFPSQAVRVWSTVPDAASAPSGWFGFSFRCSNCGWARRGDEDLAVWESDEYPELSMVASGGPAARAGLQAGDRLTHIDGYSITSEQGSKRLGAVKPGDKVRLTVSRDGKPLTRELTLGRRPEVRAAAMVAGARPTTAPRPGARRELRYTGKIEDVAVEVWSSAPSTVERVGDIMVITVGGTVIRLKADPKK
jgi:hypothetical protein